LVEAPNDKALTLTYAPLQAQVDFTNRSHNEKEFEYWHSKILNAIMMIIRVPKSILDKYAYQILFGISHKNTYVWPKVVNKDTFKMWLLPYYIL